MRSGVRRDGLTRRQTPLSNNYKTVIRQASDAESKLGKIKNADGNGDAPYLVPTPRIGGRATMPSRFGLAGFSSADGQIGYDPTRRGVTISCSGQAARVRHQSRLYVSSGQCRPVPQRGYDASTQQTVGMTAQLSRQHSSVSHPTDGYQ